MNISFKEWFTPLPILTALAMLASIWLYFDHKTWQSATHDMSTDDAIAQLIDSSKTSTKGVENLTVAVDNLRTSVVRLDSAVNGLKESYRDNDAALSSRVLTLERELLERNHSQNLFGNTFDGTNNGRR